MIPKNLLILLAATTLIGGCAATIPTELARARDAYQQASQGPAANLVPSDLHKAHEALNDAEAAFADDPRGYHTKDLAYVAQRKAELAQALAMSASDQKSTAAANSQYQTAQDAIMLDTKARLGASQSDLAASQTAVALTAEQLKTSEAARLAADKRASDAVAALAKLAAVKEEARGLVITLSGSVLFLSDEATLASGATTRLTDVANALLATKERTILIEGHTDAQGTDAYNLDLSQRRAEAVRSFLVQKGYDAALIRAVGIGESRPVGDNATAEGRANNRRVEIVLERVIADAR